MAKAKVKKYKLKTHKATAKRFRQTGSGLIVRTKGGKTHFRRRRSQRAKNMLNKTITILDHDLTRRIKRLAPYLGLYKQNPPA